MDLFPAVLTLFYLVGCWKYWLEGSIYFCWMGASHPTTVFCVFSLNIRSAFAKIWLNSKWFSSHQVFFKGIGLLVIVSTGSSLPNSEEMFIGRLGTLGPIVIRVRLTSHSGKCLPSLGLSAKESGTLDFVMDLKRLHFRITLHITMWIRRK